MIFVIYLCIHGKWFPWNGATRLCDSRKSNKSIDFDLAKQVLISPTLLHPKLVVLGSIDQEVIK